MKTLKSLIFMLTILLISNSCKKEEENLLHSSNDQIFYIQEKCEQGSIIDTIWYYDPEKSSMIFQVLDNEISEIFEIERTSGIIKVADPYKLNFFLNNKYEFYVQIQDPKDEYLSVDVKITVIIIMVNTLHSMEDFSTSIKEDIKNDDILGQITIEDRENSKLSMEISNKKAAEIFKVSDAGLIRIKDNSSINFEKDSVYSFYVTGRDQAENELVDSCNSLN